MRFIAALALMAAICAFASIGHAENGLVGPNGGNLQDYSANAQSLSGLNKLGEIPAGRNGINRLGYAVQVQDTQADCGSAGGNPGGVVVAFDDGNGSTPLIVILGFAAVKGGQGGYADMSGLPHFGRIRFYGAAGCQVGAGQILPGQ